MLSIRKRQTEHLASLILDHCSTVRRHELYAAKAFPDGIDPPCVAVIDLDEVPQDVVTNKYSIGANHHGLACMLVLFEITMTLVVHVFYMSDWTWPGGLNWIICGSLNLFYCLIAVILGDGTLTLARRSDTFTPGCAVLLDHDFTVILIGSQSVVEAIAEANFNLSSPNSVWKKIKARGNQDNQEFHIYLLQAFCEGCCLCFVVLCWLLFRPSTAGEWVPLIAIIIIVTCLLQFFPPDRPRRIAFAFVGIGFCIVPPLIFLGFYVRATGTSMLPLLWHLVSFFLFFLFALGYPSRNYPIRSARFLDVLGHPKVRKWQFDTFAAAATFQCLVLCHGIPCPIRTIDVLAFLDMLVPDQRDLWKAWKERVADRIVHEKDILFAPTIPTFADERQQQLKDHLDQAQFGYDTYMDSYSRRVPLYPVT